VTTERRVAPVLPTIPTAHGGRSAIRSPQQPVRFSGGTRGRLPPVRPEDAERAQERRPSAEPAPDGRDARQGSLAMMVPAEAVRATGARSAPGPTRIPYAGAGDTPPERAMSADLPRPGQGDAAPASGGKTRRPGAWIDPQDPDWTARLMIDQYAGRAEDHATAEMAHAQEVGDGDGYAGWWAIRDAIAALHEPPRERPRS
jgi:hypothetical protein